MTKDVWEHYESRKIFEEILTEQIEEYKKNYLKEQDKTFIQLLNHYYLLRRDAQDLVEERDDLNKMLGELEDIIGYYPIPKLKTKVDHLEKGMILFDGSSEIYSKAKLYPVEKIVHRVDWHEWFRWKQNIENWEMVKIPLETIAKMTKTSLSTVKREMSKQKKLWDEKTKDFKPAKDEEISSW